MKNARPHGHALFPGPVAPAAKPKASLIRLTPLHCPKTAYNLKTLKPARSFWQRSKFLKFPGSPLPLIPPANLATVWTQKSSKQRACHHANHEEKCLQECDNGRNRPLTAKQQVNFQRMHRMPAKNEVRTLSRGVPALGQLFRFGTILQFG
jgi:hypothetical protein